MSFEDRHFEEHNVFNERQIVRYKTGAKAIADLLHVKEQIFKLDVYCEGVFVFKSECDTQSIEIEYQESRGISIFTYERVADLLELGEIRSIKINLMK